MKKISLSFVLGLLFFTLAQFFFTITQAKLIGVIAFLVTLWTNSGLPLGITSLLPLILFPVLGIIDLKTATPNYSKSIIFYF